MSQPVEYRDIAGFPGYRVGNDGSVWSCRQKGGCAFGMTKEWTRLHPVRDATGHRRVCMMQNRKERMRYVHALVLEAFVCPRPPGMQACHFPDRDPSNNNLNNLRWGTAKENSLHRDVHGTMCRGEKCHKAKLTELQVVEIRTLRQQGASHRKLAKRYGVAENTIARIIAGRTWSHVSEGLQ